MLEIIKVLMVHNRYRIRGGEDTVYEAEIQLLRENGIEVMEYEENNQTITSDLTAARRAIWSQETYTKIRNLLRYFNANIVHVHNFFPLISPSVYLAAHASGAAVVQTLHNYRLFCINGYFLRNELVCEDCFNRPPIPGILHSCYRGNKMGSLATAMMLIYHRLRRTWQNDVDAYIALSPFSRNLFIRGGLPVEKVYLRPNYVQPDPGIGADQRDGFLFVGRLSPEKGLSVLLSAWKQANIPEMLWIIGDGPLGETIENQSNVELLGRLPLDQVLIKMKSVRALVFPSILYENMPRTILEAFACGTPVIASKLGAMADLVQEGQTGYLFEAGNPSDLARVLNEVWQAPAKLKKMGATARSVYTEKYTSKPALVSLLKIYQKAREQYDSAAH